MVIYWLHFNQTLISVYTISWKWNALCCLYRSLVNLSDLSLIISAIASPYQIIREIASEWTFVLFMSIDLASSSIGNFLQVHTFILIYNSATDLNAVYVNKTLHFVLPIMRWEKKIWKKIFVLQHIFLYFNIKHVRASHFTMCSVQVPLCRIHIISTAHKTNKCPVGVG